MTRAILWVGLGCFALGATTAVALSQEPFLTISCKSTDDGTEILHYQGDLRRGHLQIVPPPNYQYKILLQASCEVTW